MERLMANCAVMKTEGTHRRTRFAIRPDSLGLESLKGKRCCKQVKFYPGICALAARRFCLSRILKAGPGRGASLRRGLARFMIIATWPWLALILLGAWHGLNPGMGWLFSVALGLQQRSRRAVFAALLPIALGHALAIGLVVLPVYIVGAVIPSQWLQIGGAATLFSIAIWKLWRARHPTWVGMRVSFWDLTTWSWLMATAHGAGLMVVPVLLGGRSMFCGAIPSNTNSLLFFQPLIVTAAVGVHTLSHLVIAGLVAWIVYDFVGLAVLRRSWVNLDLIWCFSLLGAAVILFFVPLA